MYVWIYEYKDTTGTVRYGICASPTKPTPEQSTSYTTYDDSDVPFLYVDETTKEIKDKRQDPTYLDEQRNDLINKLKEQTYNTIIEHMPLWRQNSWGEYIRCYEKMQQSPLTKAEQLTISEMTDRFKTTPSDAYSKCQDALEWIVQCKLADEEMDQQIQNTSTYDEIEAIDITKTNYPEWTIGE